MSLIGLVLAPGALFFALADYRALSTESLAEIGTRDFLFAFAVFGIGAVIYQVLLGKHVHKARGQRHQLDHITLHWISHLIIIAGLWAFISLMAILVFSLSSIGALIIGGIMIGIYAIADRRDLLLNALVSGLIVAILVFIVEQLFFIRLYPGAAADFWQLSNLSGILLGGIPVEEIIWAAVVGFAIGPLYEYVRNIKLK
ncbi:lycopene cyclase domain-containing protein [Patescibacteria group bacterium]